MTEEQWIERPSEEVREDAGDEPRSDEQFIVMAPGHQVSQTFGRDAVYYYYEEDNRTQRLPFR